jgi:hypothetical protein
MSCPISVGEFQFGSSLTLISRLYYCKQSLCHAPLRQASLRLPPLAGLARVRNDWVRQMTFATAGLAITPTPVFAITAVPPMTADGMRTPGEAGAGISGAERGSMPDAQEAEIMKSAQLDVQVPNALLGLFIAKTPTTNTPDGGPSAASAYYAVDAAASSQTADNDSARRNSGGSGDTNTSGSCSLSGVDASLQATGIPPHKIHRSDPPVRIIPQWHIRPGMKTA